MGRSFMGDRSADRTCNRRRNRCEFHPRYRPTDLDNYAIDRRSPHSLNITILLMTFVKN